MPTHGDDDRERPTALRAACGDDANLDEDAMTQHCCVCDGPGAFRHLHEVFKEWSNPAILWRGDGPPKVCDPCAETKRVWDGEKKGQHSRWRVAYQGGPIVKPATAAEFVQEMERALRGERRFWLLGPAGPGSWRSDDWARTPINDPYPTDPDAALVAIAGKMGGQWQWAWITLGNIRRNTQYPAGFSAKMLKILGGKP
jgi:hypothetical protein